MAQEDEVLGSAPEPTHIASQEPPTVALPSDLEVGTDTSNVSRYNHSKVSHSHIETELR